MPFRSKEESIAIPHSLLEIVQVFGDPTSYVTNKSRWKRTILDTMTLSQTLPYAYLAGARVGKIIGHKLIVDKFAKCLEACLAASVSPARLVYGGIYCWRAKRSGLRLSTHTWGIAIDLDPAHNPHGRKWQDDGVMLDKRIAEVFVNAGFTWGNDFAKPDPMHFQWAKGY